MAGDVHPVWADPPTHPGQRVYFVSVYERKIDNGMSDEEARKEALAEARLWRLYFEAGLLPNQKECEELMRGGSDGV
jgi:hypothetical protein